MKLMIFFKKYYRWEGVDKQFKKIKGDEYTRNNKTLKKILKNRSITLLNAEKRYHLNIRRNSINSHCLAQLCFQLSSLLNTGITLTTSIKIICKDCEHKSLLPILIKIHTHLASGKSFSESLSIEKNLFPEPILAMIAAAEHSGKLTIILSQIAQHLERLTNYKSKIKKAFYYPTMILTVSIVITIALLIFIIPQFQTLYSNFGATLPKLTLIIITFSNILTSYGFILFFLIITLGFILYKYCKRQPKLTAKINKLLFKLPLLHSYYLNNDIYLWSSLLNILLEAGIPLIHSTHISTKTLSNAFIKESFIPIKRWLNNGLTFYDAVAKTGIFPAGYLQMILIGEESGQLPKMLQHISMLCSKQLNLFLESLSTLIEPCIILIIAVITGTLVIGMYLPIFDISSLA